MSKLADASKMLLFTGVSFISISVLGLIVSAPKLINDLPDNVLAVWIVAGMLSLYGGALLWIFVGEENGK